MWTVIALCTAMMIAEIVGGLLFGSIALVADGFHMSTHAGALLLAALAYTYARRSADDPRFTFGPGKFGDLAGFASADHPGDDRRLIGYESVGALLFAHAHRFAQAIPIAALGLARQCAQRLAAQPRRARSSSSSPRRRAWARARPRASRSAAESKTRRGAYRLKFSRRGAATLSLALAKRRAARRRRRLRSRSCARRRASALRDDRSRRSSRIRRTQFPSRMNSPRRVQIGVDRRRDRNSLERAHAHGSCVHRDNNMRAAVIHVMADAAVSILVIVGLSLARGFGWLWMDPLAGLVGAGVIASWSAGLIRDTGAVLLDMNPDRQLTEACAARSSATAILWPIFISGGWVPGIWAPSCRSRRKRARDQPLSRGRDGRRAFLAPDDRDRAPPRSAEREPRRFVA